MTYQKRLFTSILFALLMFCAVCAAMMAVTSCQESRFPNILETMPNLK